VTDDDLQCSDLRLVWSRRHNPGLFVQNRRRIRTLASISESCPNDDLCPPLWRSSWYPFQSANPWTYARGSLCSRHPPSSLSHYKREGQDRQAEQVRAYNRTLNMATSNPELQEKLQELEHELEVSFSLSDQGIKCFESCRVRHCTVTLYAST